MREIGDRAQMSDEELAHQREAYRKAWEPFDPGGEDKDDDDSDIEQEQGRNPQMGEEEETNKGRMLRTPRTPTIREVEEHATTHWPVREWCDHCIKGKAKSRDTRGRSTDPRYQPLQWTTRG